MRVEAPKFIGRDGEGNFGAGWIGFSFRDNNFVSQGIVFFTDLDELNSIEVSHSFYTVDGHTIIEAEANGVVMSDPSKYFNDPHIHVFFRKPIHLSSEYTMIMTNYAFGLVGKSYDYGLFINFLWQWFCSKTGIPISKKSPPLLDDPDKLVCSEVSASSLNKIPEYANLFPLSEWHPARISPMLLLPSEIFEPMEFDI
jgi:hypothetical protein